MFKSGRRCFALLSKEGGIDTDEEGLSDSTETELSAYSNTVSEVLGTSILNLDPDNEESIPGRKDKSVASGYLSQLESELINITIVAEDKVNLSKRLKLV